jgi:hypothetical protein
MATQDVTLTEQEDRKSVSEGDHRMRAGVYRRYVGVDDSGSEHFVAEVWCRVGYTPSKITVTYT